MLLQEIGKARYAADALTTYVLREVSALSSPLSLLINAAICVASSFALAHVWSLCSLDRAELAQVFLPLPGLGDDSRLKSRTGGWVVAILVAGLMIMLALFQFGEAKAKEMRQINGYSPVEMVIGGLSNVSAYNINGAYYDSQDVDDAISRLLEEGDGCLVARDNLEQAIRDAYGKCKENAEAYLGALESEQNQGPLEMIGSWFSSLFDSGSANSVDPRDAIIAGVDFSAVHDCANKYNDARNSLESQVQGKLENMGISQIEETIVKTSVSIEEYFGGISGESLLVLDIPDVDTSDLATAKEVLLQAIDRDCEETLSRVPVTQPRQ